MIQEDCELVMLLGSVGIRVGEIVTGLFDPCRFFTEAPDAIRLMLTQASLRKAVGHGS